MEPRQALLLEFAARKEHVLNLEMRFFLLALAIQAHFLLVYVYHLDRVRESAAFSFGSASVFFLLVFESIAINAKMGLISIYLRQMEMYMASSGYVGVVWESKALDAIIFRPGNTFTLVVIPAVLCVLGQSLFVAHNAIAHLTSSRLTRLAAFVAVAVILLGIIARSITVDFFHAVPRVFDGPQQGERAVKGP